jgi:hypothetical protein
MAENGTPERGLTPTQHRVIAALLSARDVRSAAKAAHVAERTLYRWLAEDPAFVQELRQAEGAAIDETTRRLIALQAKALDALEGALDTTGPLDATVRVRAALGLGGMLLKLVELRDIEERLRALEEAANGKPD